ncbi:MAG: GNAT family N-acetyltransferase [Liquorilactobacillus ghanensis]|uniref:GNAT family N-acetyltransferase n=1 Tax=Liquorilactobacillus ghanensis TaxID=399370 RepID=UPI0039EC317C
MQVKLQTKRLYFSTWTKDELNLALSLWGNPKVAKYIHKNGIFTKEEVELRLNNEISNFEKVGIQYFPIFFSKSHEFMGVCGFRPTKRSGELEFGIHLLPKFWHKGLATEAAQAIITYAFTSLKINSIVAGHNPQNNASKKLLTKLGFKFVRNEYYPPTGLNHPTYVLSEYHSCD